MSQASCLSDFRMNDACMMAADRKSCLYVGLTNHVSPCTLSCSSLTFLPPMRRPALNSCFLPILRSSSKICKASSLVGEMTRAPRPSKGPHFSLYNFSNTYVCKPAMEHITVGKHEMLHNVIDPCASPHETHMSVQTVRRLLL